MGGTRGAAQAGCGMPAGASLPRSRPGLHVDPCEAAVQLLSSATRCTLLPRHKSHREHAIKDPSVFSDLQQRLPPQRPTAARLLAVRTLAASAGANKNRPARRAAIVQACCAGEPPPARHSSKGGALCSSCALWWQCEEPHCAAEATSLRRRHPRPGHSGRAHLGVWREAKSNGETVVAPPTTTQGTLTLLLLA